MLKKYARLIAAGLFAADLLVTVLSFLGTFLFFRLNPLEVSYGRLLDIHQYLWLLLLVIPVWSILLQVGGLYNSHRTETLWSEIKQVVRAVTLGGAALFAAVAITKSEHISRLFLLAFLAVDGIFLGLLKLLIRSIAHWIRLNGLNTRSVVIVGTGLDAQAQALQILRNGQWGMKLLGFVADGEPPANSSEWENPVLGSVRDIRRILCEYVVDEVFIAVSVDRLPALEPVFLECEEIGVKTQLALNMFPHRLARMELTKVGGGAMLTFTTTPREDWALSVKRTMDVVGSLMFMVMFSWLYTIIAVLVKTTSKGPVFYTQDRVGLRGRKFKFYKFRSMCIDADAKKHELKQLNEMDGPVFKIKNDPRVTRVGRFIRKFSLDELPQMWNVFKGDMSLVGPRPPIPSEVEKYETWARRRLSIRPGLTCLWQVEGRNGITFQRWMELDLAYIDNWSLGLDLKILLKTVPAVLGGRGAS
jgi:exopolysaccharide biosynthesis polyprenyl glycosylphosphotransferase